MSIRSVMDNKRRKHVSRTRRLCGLEELERRRLLDSAGVHLSSSSWLNAVAADSSYQTLLVSIASWAEPGTPQGLSPQCYGVRPTPKAGLWELQVPQAVASPIISALRSEPGVTNVEPLFEITTSVASNFLLPDDISFAALYGLHNTGQTPWLADADIDAPEAWDHATSALGVVVADIDTGVDYRHIDLYRNIWINQEEIPASRLANLTDLDGDGRITFWDLNNSVNQGPGKINDLNANGYIDGGDLLQPLVSGGWANGASDDGDSFVDDLIGWDFVNNDNDPIDDHGHGTHTVGTIAAMGNNALGVAGVVWQAEVMVLKALGSNGAGSNLTGSRAVDYSVAKGAVISSNSWGSSNFSTLIYNSVASAASAGQLFVAAAGNSNINSDVNPFYPAAFDLDNVLSVAATDAKDLKASFSNYGLTTVDLGAPGVGILSTSLNDTYVKLSGTSMATPHVAGAAALVQAVHPDWQFDDIKERLLSTVDTLASMQGRTVSGGRLNVAAAVDTSAVNVPGSGIDLRLQQITTDGNRTLNLSYEIVGNSLEPFDIGFYRSEGAKAGSDLLLDWVRIDDPLDLTVGTHSKNFAIGVGDDEISLPGAGTAETDTDYFILALADRLQVIAEDDVDSFAEDNMLVVSVAYRGDTNDIHLLTSNSDDSITITTVGENLNLNVNGQNTSYPATLVANFRIRSHGGHDAISGTTIAKSMRIWAGDGDDLLSGGAKNDTITGGSGSDHWTIQGTAANDNISITFESATRIRQTRGSEIDRFDHDGNDHLHLFGNDGNDTLAVAANVLVSANLHGGDGNDVLTGGGADDVLVGGVGNDTLNGRGGSDQLDAGLGTDTWNFEGTTAVDFISGDWDDALEQIVVERRPSQTAPATEEDRGSSLEKINILASNAADNIGFSNLTAGEMLTANIQTLTLDGGAGNDTIIGSGGNDVQRGNNDHDLLLGGDGNDYLDGGMANDQLFGEDGEDQILGAGGNDSFFGGAGNDQLTIAKTQGSSTNIDGGSGSDKLFSAKAVTNWNISGLNAGTLNGFVFVNVEHLNGSSSTDNFFLSPGGLLTGTVNGGSGTNKIDYSGFADPVVVDHQTKQAAAIGSYASIGSFVGSPLVDTFVGSNTTNTWNITASNRGTLNTSLVFENFENLSGGSGADTFKFAAFAAQITGSIDGNAGTDKLDYGNFGAAILVNLELAAATAIAGGFSEVESLAGSALVDTLVGANLSNTWLITAENGGTLGSFAFSAIESLAGGNVDDVFRFSDTRRVTGTIDGAAGINTLDYANYKTPITVDLSAGTATATNGIANVMTVIGGSAADQLTGDAGDNVFLGNAGDDNLNAGGGFDILVAGAGNDTMLASAGRSVLIGGSGADQANGGSSDDLIIGGSTIYDALLTSLQDIQREWTRADASYSERIDHLRGMPGGLNGSTLLNTNNVIHDNAVDTLFGFDGDDWFWAKLPQYVQDQEAGEEIN